MTLCPKSSPPVQVCDPSRHGLGDFTRRARGKKHSCLCTGRLRAAALSPAGTRPVGLGTGTLPHDTGYHVRTAQLPPKSTGATWQGISSAQKEQNGGAEQVPGVCEGREEAPGSVCHYATPSPCSDPCKHSDRPCCDIPPYHGIRASSTTSMKSKGGGTNGGERGGNLLHKLPLVPNVPSYQDWTGIQFSLQTPAF